MTAAQPPRRCRGKPPNRPRDPIIEQIKAEIGPLSMEERREIKAEYRAMQRGVDALIGPYRGHGPTRELALQKALVGEDVYSPDAEREIQNRFNRAVKRVLDGACAGGRYLRDRAVEQRARRTRVIVRKHHDIVEDIRNGTSSINRAAALLRRRGVDGGHSTLRKLLTSFRGGR